MFILCGLTGTLLIAALPAYLWIQYQRGGEILVAPTLLVLTGMLSGLMWLAKKAESLTELARGGPIEMNASLATIVVCAAAVVSSPAMALDFPAHCADGHVRAISVSSGFVSSIPVWSQDGPVLCAADRAYVNGRQLPESEVTALVTSTLTAHLADSQASRGASKK